MNDLLSKKGMVFYKKIAKEFLKVFGKLNLESSSNETPKTLDQRKYLPGPLCSSTSGIYVHPDPEDQILAIAPNYEFDHLSILKIIPKSLPENFSDKGLTIYFGDSQLKFFPDENKIELWKEKAKIFSLDEKSMVLEKDLVVNGKLEVKGSIASDKDLVVNGKVEVKGSISSDSDISSKKDVKAGIKTLLSHIHGAGTLLMCPPGGGPATGTTGGPSVPVPTKTSSGTTGSSS